MDSTGGTGLADPVIGLLLDGRYRVDRSLARGGMATVYSATDTRLERAVAVKVMHPALVEDPEFVARFQREAKAAARISSPFVVSVTDTGADQGVVFLVMELVRGRTLRSLLHERGRLSPLEALDIMEPVAGALAAAHRAGLVHRDVKPENVLLSDEGQVKVADFGLARALEANRLTATTGLLLGTVAYLAPEQVSTGAADARSDVYAAGVMLFELLTGQPPYSGDTPLAVAYRHVHDTVPPPGSTVSGIPGVVNELVLTMTAREPAARPPDGEALAGAIRRARQQLAMGGAVSHDTKVVTLPDAHTTALDLGGAATTTFTAPGLAETAVVAGAAAAAGLTTALSPGSPRDTQVLPGGGTGPPQPPAGAGSVGGGSGPRRPVSAQTRRRRRWLVVAVVVVLVSLGAALAGWQLGKNHDVAVPQLTGDSLATATELATTAHVTLHVGAAMHSDTIGVGKVVATSPKFGAKVHRGALVVYHLSDGPLMETVPAVATLSPTKAVANLRATQLDPTLKDEYSLTVTKGVVIGTSPVAGTVLRHNSIVTVIISKGPAPVTMPNLVGQPAAAAEATLKTDGLTYGSPTSAYSTTVPTGDVLTQSVPVATVVPEGSPVVLSISLGPQFVTVPNVQGQSAEAATQQLKALGLKVDDRKLPGTSGTVVDETDVGDSVQVGTTVVIYSI